MKKQYKAVTVMTALLTPIFFSGCVLLDETPYIVQPQQPVVYTSAPVVIAPAPRPKHYHPAPPPRYHVPKHQPKSHYKSSATVNKKTTVVNNNTTVIVNKNEYNNTVNVSGSKKRPASGSVYRPSSSSTAKRPANKGTVQRPSANSVYRPASGKIERPSDYKNTAKRPANSPGTAAYRP